MTGIQLLTIKLNPCFRVFFSIEMERGDRDVICQNKGRCAFLQNNFLSIRQARYEYVRMKNYKYELLFPVAMFSARRQKYSERSAGKNQFDDYSVFNIL